MKPRVIIKNHTGGISLLNEVIKFLEKPLYPCTFKGAKYSSFGTSLIALPPCLPLNDFSATPLSFLPPKIEPLGFSLVGQLRVAP